MVVQADRLLQRRAFLCGLIHPAVRNAQVVVGKCILRVDGYGALQSLDRFPFGAGSSS